MKKTINLLMTTLLLFLSLNMIASASSVSVSTQNVFLLENGDYIIETIVTEKNNVYRANTAKSGRKIFSYYNSKDTLLWSATLKGTFTYTGSRATCTASSITHTVYDDNWKITSAVASKSGNTAKGDITAKYYVLGIPAKTVERTISLTCSSSGVLS